jgi:hypothetical protein
MPTTIGAPPGDDFPDALEPDDDELLHPARASATAVSAGTAAPMHVRTDRDIIPTLRPDFVSSDYLSDINVTIRNGT